MEPDLSRPPRTVLVADDDADMRLYLAGCLHAFGVEQVVEAADGREAFTLAKALRPDLVISDVVMPGLDGAALSHALRSDRLTGAIPVLLISGETRARPSPADGFLTKPFNAAKLRVHVDRLLATRPASKRRPR
ncbi:MAG: response regulator [Bacteroidota bacterium]